MLHLAVKNNIYKLPIFESASLAIYSALFPESAKPSSNSSTHFILISLRPEGSRECLNPCFNEAVIPPTLEPHKRNFVVDQIKESFYY